MANSEKVAEIMGKTLDHNTEYNKLDNKSITLFEQIIELLPNESRNLMFEFNEAMVLKEVISQNVLYNKGLIDGTEKFKTLISIIKKVFIE